MRAISFITACIMYKMGIADETLMAALRGAMTGSTKTEEIELFPKKLFLFMIIPEFMVITAFLILFWQLMALFNLGHANFFELICVGRGKQIITLTIGLLGILQVLMIGLYLGSCLSATAFSIECTVLNFLVATSVVVIIVVTSLMYSGTPYRSLAYKIKMRKLTIATLIWCTCRYFRGISGAFEQQCLAFVLHSLTYMGNDSIAVPVLVILLFVIEEVIPMMIVLDWSFMEIFVLHADVNNYNFLRSGSPGYTGRINQRNYIYTARQEISEQLNNHIIRANLGTSNISSAGGYVPLAQINEQSSRSSSQSPEFIRRSQLPPNNGNGQHHLSDSEQAPQPMHRIHLNIGGGRATASSAQINDLGAAVRASHNNIAEVNLLRRANTQNIISQQVELQILPQTGLMQLNESIEYHDEQETFQLQVNKNEFQLLQVFSQRPDGLGIIHEAKLRESNVLCRVIQFQRVKHYNIEDFTNDMCYAHKLGRKNIILPLLGYYFDDKKQSMNIFMPKETSLHQIIHPNVISEQLTPQLKKQLAICLARSIKSLHEYQRDNYLRDSDQKYHSHKHLTSHNVLISGFPPSGTGSGDLRVLLGDMESDKLRKYASFFMGYKNLTAWSAPELFQNEKRGQREPEGTPSRSNNLNLSGSDQHSSNHNDQYALDIYSLSIILWELETEIIPLEGFSQTEIQKYIVEKNLRPQIPSSTDPNLAALIRSCWQRKPENRPKISEVCEILDKVEFSSQNILAASSNHQRYITAHNGGRRSSASAAMENEDKESFYCSFQIDNDQ